jgi:hypothetical protein
VRKSTDLRWLIFYLQDLIFPHASLHQLVSMLSIYHAFLHQLCFAQIWKMAPAIFGKQLFHEELVLIQEKNELAIHTTTLLQQFEWIQEHEVLSAAWASKGITGMILQI